MDNHSVTGLTALVAVEKALYSFDRLYSYAVPYNAAAAIAPGKRVSVPFGRGARKITGMVFALVTQEYDPFKIKAIDEVLDDEAHMNGEMLGIARWLKDNTFCTYYNAVRCILPPVLRNNTAFPKSRTEKIVRLPDESELPDTLTPKQRAVIEALEGGSSASVKELCYLCGVTAAVVTNLVKKGILEDVGADALGSPHDVPGSSGEYRGAADSAPIEPRDVGDIALNAEQSRAFDTLVSLMNAPAPKCALLHGVTGSGKTSVFIKLVGECLAVGLTALVLVPEISLTPQTIGIFNSYFGDTAAVIHSGLSVSSRTSEYKRIRDGKARIVLGTRSAVFAPLENIGVIVIDEEGEHTYKSERSPRYHVRDVAKQRCFHHGALLLLASATPSMDSYRKAQVGKYTLLELNARYSGNALPDVRVIDSKLERAAGNTGNFSEALLQGLRANLERGEQSLILLNRRGYHTFVCCTECGEVALCPHCGIALTAHRPSRSGYSGAGSEALRCHYCGYLRANSGRCGKCGCAAVRSTGTGTQRIEDELAELFPEARILRMDADTTMTKGSYARHFAAFGNREYDIMVGTQMIAKGLDFPNVTLVGILQIDNSLYAGDYIGYERTFSLITQVVGRAGRAEKGGTAFLQTFTPEHYVLRLAAKQDYRGFYEEEAAIRKALLFPPFCDLAFVEICDVVEKSAAGAAAEFARIFNEVLQETNASRESPLPVRLLGPVKNGVGNVGGRFRYRLVIKCINSPPFRALLHDTLIRMDGARKGHAAFRVNAWFA
jgi:primosomal protein N' (replication factor Y)